MAGIYIMVYAQKRLYGRGKVAPPSIRVKVMIQEFVTPLRYEHIESGFYLWRPQKIIPLKFCGVAVFFWGGATVLNFRQFLYPSTSTSMRKKLYPTLSKSRVVNVYVTLLRNDDRKPLCCKCCKCRLTRRDNGSKTCSRVHTAVHLSYEVPSYNNIPPYVEHTSCTRKNIQMHIHIIIRCGWN